MARYLHDPHNPSLLPKRAPSTLQQLRSAGLVVMQRQHPYYQCVGAERGVMIYQRGPGLFHWFDDEGGAGAGSTPEAALRFRLGLGDIVDDDKSMKAYCRLIIGAPRTMVNDTLYRTQSACREELRNLSGR